MNLNISNEQQNIVYELFKENNVIVDSVAGSGKTTTILHIANQFPDKEILLLTYNARLKEETRNKKREHHLANIEVHSYHSFGVKYYLNTCFTDTEIDIIVKQNLARLKSYKYDIIVLDEAQDISPLLFHLICKIVKDNGNSNGNGNGNGNGNDKMQICILGDERQSIFDFNKADQRFITFADKIFSFNALEWKRCKLTQSFRCTSEMCEFINKCLYKESFIFSSKSGVKPRYMICDAFGIEIIEIIKYYIYELGYSPTDIFILAPSVKSDKSPVRQLENQIKRELRDIPVFVPVNDEAKLDNDILAGKLVFSTFHQTKGLERKVVIVFNFDNSYFLYYKKENDPNVCPNELYVATTRALEHLVLLHHFQNDYLPFLYKENIKEYCDVTEVKIKSQKSSKDKFDTAVTDMVAHLPQEVLDESYQYLDVITVKEKSIPIDIPTKIKQSYENGTDGFESVSEITGIAIPSYYEYLTKGKMSIFPEKKSSGCMIQLDEDDMEPSDEIEDSIRLDTITPEQLLYIATKYNSIRTGYLFKIYQITNYNWLSKENLQKGIDNLKTLKISKKAAFEVPFTIENQIELSNRRLLGVFDCIDVDERIFEFKCVQQLTKEHCLQLATYMYMYEKQNTTKPSSYKKSKQLNKKPKRRSYFLYNILTDELLEIRCTLFNLTRMIQCLITHKYINKKRLTDEMFLSTIMSIKEGIFI
jgi:AAA domain